MRTEIELPDGVDASVDHLELTVEGDQGAVTRRLWYPDVTVGVETVERPAADGNDDENDATDADDATDATDADGAGTERVEAVVIATEADDAKTRATVGTFESHVRNMIHGVTEGWTYELEVFYAHFPMQVAVEGDQVVITNFLGEKAPRRTAIRGDTEVSIDGEEITVSGPDKEAVGQTAASIEQLTRVTDKDTRVFQDGVYITSKPGTAKGGS
jgi:large subunit ribosomal protein L6